MERDRPQDIPVYIASAREFIRPAVIDHLYNWLASDGLFARMIYRDDGTISPSALRSICRAYGVSRGLLKEKEAAVAAMLDAELRNWPTDLLDRAAFVREMAIKAERDGFTKGKLLSAFSKVIWFLRPEGWTLYDTFARRGLMSTELIADGDEFDRYYVRLNDLRFQEAMNVARNVIQGSPFHYIWPERIYDKYLMLLGHRENLKVLNTEAHPHILEFWSAIHGNGFVSSLEKLIDDLVNEVCDHQAFQVQTMQT